MLNHCLALLQALGPTGDIFWPNFATATYYILKPCFPPIPEKDVVRQCPEKALLQVETKTLGSWKRLTRPKAVASNNVGGGFDATSAAPELALRRLSRAPALAPERAPAVGRSCDRRTLFNFFLKKEMFFLWEPSLVPESAGIKSTFAYLSFTDQSI